jgi:hypothetical protein
MEFGMLVGLGISLFVWGVTLYLLKLALEAEKKKKSP